MPKRPEFVHRHFIDSLLPLVGWGAIYVNPETGSLYREPLIALALTHEVKSPNAEPNTWIDDNPTFQTLYPISRAGLVEFADSFDIDEGDDPLFVAYAPDSEPLSVWHEKGQTTWDKYLEKQLGEPENKGVGPSA